ncbi:malic enzyme-like NAD(P)-binding protein [Campylobacter hominis]|uniref:NADP-dependent malic enzyme (Nadp-me) n=1 Tax=Campylobacter hominis (strain ATCC BAA-381 / DSM 21671 / CCUG 45161 / LMG 19568 / NCTC 13146 / CH001A) TaxID=360107 RepID=A7HZN4_CAMHC|nr:malic enzyme-like NAD(P)-binding protein [Campylobacter hominis]ABS52351.1 NADP-dependent malic enzyme (nadp-me) [Campylobacter hominis ATCC BAA-381]UAK85416.1 malate dehydrogenase [Campylobacter hominis]SUW84274.1 NADP-dependent malic enzyme (NADP-me) [Campylobacter hominis]
MINKEKALEYHIGGKTAIQITKPCESVEELSLAYSPGVAEPCKEIHKNSELAYKYTNKSNLVAVISNGTAVLGLGNIGAQAGKPVMEGKAVLFKKFGKIDAFDIEIDETDPDKFIEICKAIAPTFGGINLEDIKAPECFYIEKRLKAETKIPVMHDDQHGTAIITSAGLLNAVKISGKKIEDVKIVVSGSGAAGIACARMYKTLGAKNVIMVDSKGVIYEGRENLSPEKMEFAIKTDARTLSDAMKNADMFLGLSKAGIVSKDMVKSMAKNPIVFALANPDPEISPKDVKDTRDDAIIGTGRSDYPNQINNILGFPYIFRGALDVKSTNITENMKMAAAKALAELAREPVSDKVKKIVGNDKLEFGINYVIPNPFDERVFSRVALAVAKAAIEDGVALIKDFDLKKYKERLEAEK